MTFNEIKCHVNTFLGLMGGCTSPYPRLGTSLCSLSLVSSNV